MPAAAAGKRQPATCTNRRGRAQNTRTTSFWGSGGPVVRGKRQGNARFPSAVKTGTHCENPPSHASTFYRALAHNTHKHLRRTTRKKKAELRVFPFCLWMCAREQKKTKKKQQQQEQQHFGGGQQRQQKRQQPLSLGGQGSGTRTRLRRQRQAAAECFCSTPFFLCFARVHVWHALCKRCMFVAMSFYFVTPNIHVPITLGAGREK